MYEGNGKKIAFLTDSSSDIPAELAEKYGIDVIGFPINLEGKEYIERQDVTNEEFYELMRAAKGVPTTAAITQLQWVEIYKEYVEAGVTDLVHVSINSNGSSTYNNAYKAIEMLGEECPGHTMKIHLIDSHTYSMPFGWYLCECARQVEEGAPLDACLKEMQDKLARVEICLSAYSLKQMKKSGRVSAAAAVVGDLMGIRPIISLNDGISKVEAKVRGDANVQPAMVKWVSSRVDNVKAMPYMIAYSSSAEKRDELIKLCKKSFGHAPMCVFQLGGVISANTGPDCVAIVFEGKPRRLADYAVPLP
ncbi:MAG: DegV family protein [Gemmiger sp.]